MTEKNKHGLSRYIDSETARVIRKNAGFGCAICGLAFYQYEHFDPEFKDAIEHHPKGITLLCGTHHDLKTRGSISINAVKEAANSPKCLEQGFSHSALEFSKNEIVVQIGSTRFYNPTSILTINGDSIFSIQPPEEVGSPYLLTFIPEDSPDSNKIVKNEWFGNVGNWDITTIGNRIVVKKNSNKVILDIQNIPGEIFILNKINVKYKGFAIQDKTIEERKIGPHNIQKEKIITVTNPSGREIARFGGINLDYNEMRWPNALEVVGEYMNATMSNLTMKGGRINLLTDPNTSPTIHSLNLNSVSFTTGMDSNVRKFAQIITNLLPRIHQLNSFDRNTIRLQLAMLKHTGLYKQLSSPDRRIIEKLNI